MSGGGEWCIDCGKNYPSTCDACVKNLAQQLAAAREENERLRRQLAAIAAPDGEDVEAVEYAMDAGSWANRGRNAIAAIAERVQQRISKAEPRGGAGNDPGAVDDGCKGSGATPLGPGDAQPQMRESASPVTVALGAAAIAERVRGGQG